MRMNLSFVAVCKEVTIVLTGGRFQSKEKRDGGFNEKNRRQGEI